MRLRGQRFMYPTKIGDAISGCPVTNIIDDVLVLSSEEIVINFVIRFLAVGREGSCCFPPGLCCIGVFVLLFLQVIAYLLKRGNMLLICLT